MAFNNYYPNTYQPYYLQNQQQQANSLGPIWVQGEAAAKSYPVAPNQTVVLFDSEQNTIYLKSADNSGMPSVKMLDYTIRETAPKTTKIAPQADYATKDEVASLKEEINALKAKLSDRKERKDGK